MSWYNDNIQNGFIDTTQEFVGGGGEGGGTVDLTGINTAITNLQTELLSAQTNFNNISADFNDIKAVFIPKQINNQNIVETYIKNTFTNSIIYIVNNNTEPKVKIEGGHLYVYYTYNELVSVLDPSQFIKVSDYLIGVNVGIRNLNAAAGALGVQLGDVVNDVNAMFLIQNNHSLAISTLVSDVNTLKATDVLIIDTLNAMNAGVPFSSRFLEIGNSTAYQNILTNTLQHAQAVASRTWTFSNLSNLRFLLDNKFTLLFWGAVFVAGGNPQLAVDVFHTIRDFFLGEKINENIKQLTMSYDLAKTKTGFEDKNKLLHTGLAITFGNGGLADGEYDITLRTDNVITVKVTGGIATVIKVKSSDEQHTVGDFFNKNRSLLGGGDGLIRFTVTALYSTKEILEYEINTKFLEIEDIKGRQRRREKIINEDALGDNFTIEYTPLTESTGEISQVPTIKLNYNTTQFESVNGVISVKTDGDILAFSKLGYGFTTENIGGVLKVKLNLNTTHFEIIENMIYIKGYINSSSLTPLNTAINTLTTNVSDLQTDVGGIETNILGINTTISGIQDDITGIDTAITNANSAITTLQTDLSELQTDVATILGVNSDVVDLLDDVATLKTDVIDINGNITMINGNINVIDLDIVDVNESLERVYKVLLPVGATMTTDYRINLGFKEIYSGYPYDLMMMALKSGSYNDLTFNADDYSGDFLGYYPNMARVATTGNYNVYDTDQLAVNASQYFTKGLIYFKKINENYITNLNNKFEFVSFLKFVSFNNNTTDYPIIQSTDANGVFSNTKLKVWLRNRKLNIKHPALVSYGIYNTGTVNSITTRLLGATEYFVLEPITISGTLYDDKIRITSTPMGSGFDDYKYELKMLYVPWRIGTDNINKPVGFVRIVNANDTSQPNQDSRFLQLYLSHPSVTNQPVASCIYPVVSYAVGIKNNGVTFLAPDWYIQKIVLKFDILFWETLAFPQPTLIQGVKSVMEGFLEYTFRLRYSTDYINFTTVNFSVSDILGDFTTTGTTINAGFLNYDPTHENIAKRFLTYTYTIPNTYPNAGGRVRFVDFTLVKKPTWNYPGGANASVPWQGQAVLHLYEFNVLEYATTQSQTQVIANNYTTADTGNAFSTSIFSTSWYLFALQLDLPNNNIGFYLKGIYNNFTARSNYTLTSADITMPDPSITSISATFVSWANLTQQNGDLVIGNTPSVGSVNFTHFNWRFFQDFITNFLTLTEIQKLTEMINYGYYEEYVNIDKLLTAGEIITNNIYSTGLTINNKPLIKTLTDTIRARDLRTEQTQDPANVLIRLDNLYVEDPVASGYIFYDKITKTMTVGGGGGGGGGIGTRAEEDEIILGFIEDSAGYALMWDNVTNKLNVVPEFLYQDFTPIYDSITLSRLQTSNYVEATSNYLKNIIDNIPPPAPYNDTAITALINTKDGNVSNYVWHTSNFLQSEIDAIIPYNDTAITALINTKDGNVSNYIWHTSNFLQSKIDAIIPYNDTAITALINTKDGNVSNYVWHTSNFLQSKIDAIIPYNDTAITALINTKDGNVSNYVWHTSNYLKTDYIARDALLTTDYIARDDIITLDSIERDDNLSASIEANKYTDAKVLNLLGSSTSLVFKELTLAKDATTALSFIKYATGTTNIQAYTQIALLGNQTDIHMFFSELQYLTFTIVGIIILQIQSAGILANKTLTITGTNQLNFQTGSVSLPATITGGTGCKIIYYPSTTTYPYATGVAGSTLWSSVPNGARHEFYVNGVRCMRTTTNETILSSTNENVNCILGLSTPWNGNETTKYGCAIIAEAQTSYSRANLCLCVNNVANNTTNASTTSSLRMRMWYYAWTEFYGTYGSPSGLYSFFSAGNTTITYATGSFSNTCVKVNGTIWINGGSVAVSSTREIKKEIEELDDQECLNKLLQLKPCKYRYIDNTLNKHPTKKVFGFIAEEIKEVIPEAVDDNLTGVIPNIYENAEVQGDILTMTTKTLEINKIYTCYGEENNDKIIINVLEDLGDGNYKIDKTYDNKTNLFVYGKEIDNYHALKKEYLHALAISAIQEHNKIIMKQKEQITDLTARLERMEAMMANMLSGSA